MRQNLKLFLEIMATPSFVLKRNANILIIYFFWGQHFSKTMKFLFWDLIIFRLLLLCFGFFYVLHQTLIWEQWMFICHLSADHLLSWMIPSTGCSPDSQITDFISFWKARIFCNSHEWMLHTAQLKSPCCDENYWNWCTIPCLCSI